MLSISSTMSDWSNVCSFFGNNFLQFYVELIGRSTNFTTTTTALVYKYHLLLLLLLVAARNGEGGVGQLPLQPKPFHATLKADLASREMSRKGSTQ